MTRQETKERIEVMRQYANGRNIQVQTGYGEWVDDPDPQWHRYLQYRVKEGTSIKCGEKQCTAVGTRLIFNAGSFTQRGRECWAVITPFACIQGENGLTDDEGKPIDINRYAVKVTKKARKEYVEAMLNRQKAEL